MTKYHFHLLIIFTTRELFDHFQELLRSHYGIRPVQLPVLLVCCDLVGRPHFTVRRCLWPRRRLMRGLVFGSALILFGRWPSLHTGHWWALRLCWSSASGLRGGNWLLSSLSSIAISTMSLRPPGSTWTSCNVFSLGPLLPCGAFARPFGDYHQQQH